MGHCEAIDTTGDDTQLIPWDHWAHTGPDTREKMGPLVLVVVLYCWTLASQIIFVIGKQIDKLIDMYYCLSSSSFRPAGDWDIGKPIGMMVNAHLSLLGIGES